jgi:hypothetical protein
MNGNRLRAALLMIGASLGSTAYAQTQIRYKFPSCELLLTTDGMGIGMSGDGDAVLRATAAGAWTVADGCKDMFAQALGVASVNTSPGVETVQRPKPVEPRKEADPLRAVRDAVDEKALLVDLLIKASEVSQPDARASSRDGSADAGLVSVITTRIVELDRIVKSSVNASTDLEATTELQDLKSRNDALTKKQVAAIGALRALHIREAQVREQRDLLNQWLITLILTASLFLATALLTWLGLAITRRAILAKDRSDIANVDRRWIRQAIEEHQWIAQRTRFLPYGIGALMILSALGVLMNVVTSGETIIEPVKGGALLATLIAVLGVAKTASSWRSGIEGRIMELLKTDADLAKG